MKKKRTSKREKVAAYHETKLQQTLHDLDLIKNIPLNVPLKMKVRGMVRKDNRWTEEAVECAAKATTFNKESVRCEMIASPDMYPLHLVQGRSLPEKNKVAIKFSTIESFEPLNMEDLPLLMGCTLKYPLFSKYLKEGKIS